MNEVNVKTEIESRCGIVCSECEFLKKKICTNWCTKIDKPFHGECAVKKCCENKKLEFCGQCEEFPCELLKSYSYDLEHGDNGLRSDILPPLIEVEGFQLEINLTGWFSLE